MARLIGSQLAVISLGYCGLSPWIMGLKFMKPSVANQDLLVTSALLATADVTSTDL